MTSPPPPPPPTPATVYILTYDRSAWAAAERGTHDGHGILGAYATLAQAKEAGSRWLGEPPLGGLGGVLASWASGWRGNTRGEWEMVVAVLGIGRWDWVARKAVVGRVGMGVGGGGEGGWD